MTFSRTQFWQKPTRWGQNQMRVTHSPLMALKSWAVQGECTRHWHMLRFFFFALNAGYFWMPVFLSNTNVICTLAFWTRQNATPQIYFSIGCNLFCQLHTNQMLTFLPQLHNWLGKGQERNIENNQEETEAQGPRHCEGRHQDSPQWLLLQLFHTARG